jgi:hypothetical protein
MRNQSRNLRNSPPVRKEVGLGSPGMKEVRMPKDRGGCLFHGFAKGVML